MHDCINAERLAKIADLLIVLGRTEVWDGITLDFLERTGKDRPRGRELRDSDVEFIDHLRKPPQGPRAWGART